MTWFLKLRSLNVLVLLGFFMVALPLIAAIVTTTTFVGDLARKSAQVVELSAMATSKARRLLEQITTLERNARQYGVVGDPELLAVYGTRHTLLVEMLNDLKTWRSVSGEVQMDIQSIQADAEHIFAQLQQIRTDHNGMPELQKEFESLNHAGRELNKKLSRQIDTELTLLKENAATVQRMLYWQALSLIPLALLLAGVFTALIVRPIRQLAHAIHQLGEGDMAQAIAVRGPLDLEELGRRLDWLRRRLIELEREKNDFLSHVSHELKTPLANIREGTELLSDGTIGSLSQAQRDVFEIIQSNGQNLEGKISNLLNFNAWRTMRSELQCGNYYLNEIVDHALQQHKLAINRLGLAVDLNTHNIRIRADYDKLRVMLDNLISNAVKFSPAGGTIFIRAARQDNTIRIEIADEGPGINTDEQDRIFEPFYQGRQAPRTSVRGTGIGLAVVRECVRAHSGSIQLRQGEFPGAHFFIKLPE